jgi:hypothetical protein
VEHLRAASCQEQLPMRLTLNAYRPDRNQFVIESAWTAYHAVRLLSVWRMRRPAALGLEKVV